MIKLFKLAIFFPALVLAGCGQPQMIDTNGDGQPDQQVGTSWLGPAAAGVAGYMLGRHTGAAQAPVINRTVVHQTVIKKVYRPSYVPSRSSYSYRPSYTRPSYSSYRRYK